MKVRPTYTGKAKEHATILIWKQLAQTTLNPKTTLDFCDRTQLNLGGVTELLRELAKEGHIAEIESGTYRRVEGWMPELVMKDFYDYATRMVRFVPVLHPDLLEYRAKEYGVSLPFAKHTMRQLVRDGIAIEVTGVWRKR